MATRPHSLTQYLASRLSVSDKVAVRRKAHAHAQGRRRLALAVRAAAEERRRAQAAPLPSGATIVAECIREGRERWEAREAALEASRASRGCEAVPSMAHAQARAQLEAGRAALALARQADGGSAELDDGSTRGGRSPPSSPSATSKAQEREEGRDEEERQEHLAELLAAREANGEALLALVRRAAAAAATAVTAEASASSAPQCEPEDVWRAQAVATLAASVPLRARVYDAQGEPS